MRQAVRKAVVNPQTARGTHAAADDPQFMSATSEVFWLGCLPTFLLGCVIIIFWYALGVTCDKLLDVHPIPAMRPVLLG